jgi:hypothetical protein
LASDLCIAMAYTMGNQLNAMRTEEREYWPGAANVPSYRRLKFRRDLPLVSRFFEPVLTDSHFDPHVMRFHCTDVTKFNASSEFAPLQMHFASHRSFSVWAFKCTTALQHQADLQDALTAFNTLVNKVMMKSNALETQKRWLSCANWALRLMARYSIQSEENGYLDWPAPNGFLAAFKDPDDDVWAAVQAQANKWSNTYGSSYAVNGWGDMAPSSKKGGGGGGSGNGKGKLWDAAWCAANKYAPPNKGLTCFNCQAKGYITRNCPCNHGWRRGGDGKGTRPDGAPAPKKGRKAKKAKTEGGGAAPASDDASESDN